MRLILAALALCLIASPATAQVSRVNRITDYSGTVAAGGVSQQVVPVFVDRNLLICQNPISSTEPIFIDFGRNASSAAGGGSIQIAPGGSLSFLGAAVPTTTVNVTAATTGTRFICKTGGNQ